MTTFIIILLLLLLGGSIIEIMFTPRIDIRVGKDDSFDWVLWYTWNQRRNYKKLF